MEELILEYYVKQYHEANQPNPYVIVSADASPLSDYVKAVEVYHGIIIPVATPTYKNSLQK